MSKAIIGLVAKHSDVDKKITSTFVNDEMKDAVFANGGIAIGIIPSMRKITLANNKNEEWVSRNVDDLFTQEEKDNLVAQIKLCDGIILSGGGRTDAYEIFVAKYCYEHDIPIIGICAGQNNIVRAVGGKIKRVSKRWVHQSKKKYAHKVFISSESKFFDFVKGEMRVNSRHKNIVAECGALLVAGYDEFGNIEIVEDKTKKCYVGMRFHPESLFTEDENHNMIFKKFIEVCKK